MARYWLLLMVVFAACAPLAEEEKASRMQPSDLPNLGSAPEFVNDVWLNTDKPLRLGDLRGKVVLVDMWTFG